MEKESFLWPCQGEDEHTGVWCHCVRPGVAFRTSSTSPCVSMTPSTRHHPQGLCPCPQSKPRGSPGQGSSAQEGNPSLTAAEPPLQCPGREGLSLEGSQLAQQSGHAGAVPLHAQLDNSKPRALSLPESHICPLKQSVST